jgi:threonine dehydratase
VDRLVTREHIVAARDRIAAFVLRTPLVRSRLLSVTAGCDVFLKLESRQHTGSFKPRGALNRILAMDGSERVHGIVAASAGNHALGVAHAAEALALQGVRVFVQRTAAPAKIAKLRQFPVELRLVGETYDEAQAAALDDARRSGASFVSAYDDPLVIAGQGTAGLEIVEDLARPDFVVIPVGGGALAGGIAIAVKAACPEAKVVGVNPEASPSALLSFREGRALDPFPHGPTLAHGLAGGYGKVPFAASRDLIDEVVLVSEDDLRHAMAALIDSDQVLAEASGAAGLAAVLARKIHGLHGKVVVVVSGGNVDAATLKAVLN